MMNIGWGTRITLLYSGFVAMIVFMVYLTMQERIELVAPDYYQQELQFQGKINGKQNAEALLSGVVVKALDKGNIEIVFPKDFAANATGDITFFRPSDSDLDEKFTLKVNPELKQHILLTKGKKGLYKVKINAVVNEKPYYFEESLFLN